MNKLLDYANRNAKKILPVLLGISFIFRLIIYYTTTLFYFSDYPAYLKGIELIKTRGAIPLVNGNFLYLNSYIGYFFKYVLGSIDYYFIFNCLLGTLTSLILYFMAVKLTRNKLIGLLTVILHLFYLEFMVFSSIFYTPVIMMFLLSLIMLLLIHYFNASGYKKLLVVMALLVLINGTFYFKGELRFLWMLILLIGLINFKNRKVLTGFLLLGVLLTLSTRVLRHFHVLPYKPGNVTSNAFNFFGHTLYGGDGGDGSFVYKENEERYKKALAAYCQKHSITSPTMTDRNNFHWEEMKKFITQHPFKWVNLQFYKFFRFFGVVPETNSYKVLVSGLLKGKTVITALVLVIPFASIMLLLIITFNFQRLKKAARRPEIIFMGFLLIYYIGGSIFYGHYAERYRLPLMVCFLIPYLSWSLVNFRLKEFLSNKKALYVKTGVVILLLGIWLSQTYNALVVHKERYMKAVREVTSFPNQSLNEK